MWGQSLVKGVMLQQQSVSVDTCIRQDLSLSTLALAEKKLIADYLPDETARVEADPMHLDFIIRNLLANAIKYSRNGGSITIRIHHDKKPGYVVISVKDDGVGIPTERLPMIFHPTSSTPGTQNEKGTGIGLMLCREFALLNGGEIWVESEEGRGATFYLAFKAAE
jgi:signal transduction histidine kinase